MAALNSRNIIRLAALLAFGMITRAQGDAVLPPGVHTDWDWAKAWHETTPTRERLCINGLWRWQPADADAAQPPSSGWGYFKVPGCWPGIQDYMQSDYQTLFSDPSWARTNLGEVQRAWYERTITIPQNWAGRRIAVDVEYLNSYAAVFVDGHPAGEIHFPAGQADLSAAVRPGSTHVLSLWVAALPLKAVLESYTDTNAAKKKKGRVERRGLCGDVWLIGEPAGARISQAKVDTSFRQSAITFTAGVQGLAADARYKLRAQINDEGRQIAQFEGPAFSASDLKDGRASFSASWMPRKLWDLDTPQNQYTAQLSLLNADGQAADVAAPVRFGFREFWIQGRDFYLNGTPLHLSVVPLDNAEIGAALATYSAAKESFLRLQSFGINFVYTHNYGCEPGAHLSFEEILRAADDTGMLVALSQPHFSAYDWKSSDADQTNGYARHAEFYTRVAGSHPSVVAYAMSHNATGYNEDMNPAKIDGLSNDRDEGWAGKNAKLALRCEAIVKKLDPARIVYHHSSGNLSAMYTLNFYPNFVPSQELDDWFEHWSTAGVKPLVLVEYGAPFAWDWTMYRGWHNGKREFGSAPAPWEYCIAEWDAQFLGDAAYRISDREKANLRWEAEQFRQGRLWHHWDYPYPVGDARMDELQPVQAAYTTDNWRAFRGWGLSGNSPWEHERFWKLRGGFQPHRQDLPVDWDNLQKPGYSPDFMDRTYARFDLAYERSDWVATATAESLFRNNRPLLGWIAGRPEHFTAKDHIYHAGDNFEKELIVINNSRETVTCDVSWSADFAPPMGGLRRVTLPAGRQTRIRAPFIGDTNTAPGLYKISAKFKFSTGETQEDSFALRVIRRAVPPRRRNLKIALFDPPGQTAQWLEGLGISFRSIDAAADLSAFDMLLIGKGALTVSGAAPSLERVRDGLKIVVFEQTADALEKRLGFRVEEYGLRQAWPRVTGSPLLAGLDAGTLRDWRGSSTLLPPTLDYKLSQKYDGAPAVTWCGLETPRLWRCGNWGNVASVLIEKPPRGDFLPIIDGGYALQYSPLLEYREGRGMVLFCQMDVTARTESDPAAETLACNILRYAEAWKPLPRRGVAYLGGPRGQAWLAACGISPAPTNTGVLAVAPGADNELAKIKNWVKAGGKVLALGLNQTEANAFLPAPVTMQTREHIAACFPPFSADSPLAGVAPADIHNRDPHNMPLLTGGAVIYGDGVLATAGNVVFCQLPPFQVADPAGVLSNGVPFNLRRTFERTSIAVSRLLGNLGASGSTPLLERFGRPADAAENRWLDGLYLTHPVEWDDPYRFFGW